MKLTFVCFLFLALSLAHADDAVDLTRQDCTAESVCFIQVPGAVCADGTTTGFSVLYRKGAKKLYLYFDGGGACWNKETCEKGTAVHLSEQTPYEGPYSGQDSSSLGGWRDFQNPDNPIADGYNVARLPYCTADIWMGDKVVNYGTIDKPYVIRHVGHRNVEKILREVRKRFPDPDSILLMGTSGGGLGVSYNVHQVRTTYPRTKMFVLNDSGLPFKTPYVSPKSLEELYTNWGVNGTNPISGPVGMNVAASILEFNQTNYPDVPYGFISGYKDWTMTFFAKMLGSPNFTVAVRQTMQSLADEEFTHASNYKVFYLDDFWHGYISKDPSKVVSKGIRLSDWTKAMLNESNAWVNVRPDKP